MRKFTTPTITLVVRGVDLSDKDVFVTNTGQILYLHMH